MMTQIYCGVDASQARLDSFIATDIAEGIEVLRVFAVQHGAQMILMESSGSVERLAYTLLWKSSMPCVLVNPRAVRDFARAIAATAP